MKLAVAALALAAASSPALAAGQLSRAAVPVSYDITVMPDARALTFTGSEQITVDVREATRTLTLNAADLDIATAAFDGRAASVKADKAAQLITVTLPAATAPGRHRTPVASRRCGTSRRSRPASGCRRWPPLASSPFQICPLRR